MKKKLKYKVAGLLLKEGEINEFSELQHYVSKVNFGKDIGVGFKRMNKLFGVDISSLSLGEILNAARIINVDFDKVLLIALAQFQKEVDPQGKTKIKLTAKSS